VDVPEKIAANNAVFRDANDEIDAAAADHALDPHRSVPFICECSDGRCTAIIRLTLNDYRRVRSDPRLFVHAPGHEPEVKGIVRLRERNEGYIVVEKIGEAGAAAARFARQPSEEERGHGRDGAPEG
jgi:hypothetical protein